MTFRNPSNAALGGGVHASQALSDGRFAQVTRLTSELQGERTDVTALKSQLWALTSDVLPRMQEQLRSLRLELRQRETGAGPGRGRPYTKHEGLRKIGKMFANMDHPAKHAVKHMGRKQRPVARHH